MNCHCSFCSNIPGKVIFRTPEKVLQEIDLLKEKYGFNKLLFLDDSFTVNKQRLSEILDGLSRADIQYRCYARSDNSHNEELLKLMLTSGCIELGVGIESGSQKILDLVNKKDMIMKLSNYASTEFRAPEVNMNMGEKYYMISADIYSLEVLFKLQLKYYLFYFFFF